MQGDGDDDTGSVTGSLDSHSVTGCDSDATSDGMLSLVGTESVVSTTSQRFLRWANNIREGREAARTFSFVETVDYVDLSTQALPLSHDHEEQEADESDDYVSSTYALDTADVPTGPADSDSDELRIAPQALIGWEFFFDDESASEPSTISTDTSESVEFIFPLSDEDIDEGYCTSL